MKDVVHSAHAGGTKLPDAEHWNEACTLRQSERPGSVGTVTHRAPSVQTQIMSQGKRPIDWLSTPKTEAKERDKPSIFTSIYACKLDRGRGAATGKFQLKVFCKRYVRHPAEFSARIDARMVIGQARWQPEREEEQPGGRTKKFDAFLIVDVFSKPYLELIKQFIVEELVAEKVSKNIVLDDPKPRTALDKPPEAIALTLSNGAEYEGELLNLVLSGDTTYLHEKLVLLGGEYDRSLDQTLFTLNEDCTQAFVTENLQSLCEMAGYTLTVSSLITPSNMPQTTDKATTPLPCAILSHADLILEEEDLTNNMQKLEHRANTAAEEKQKLHACYLDIEMATGVPVLDVIDVLGAFAQMGASAGELKHELRKLLLDVDYWLEWCASGKGVWHDGV